MKAEKEASMIASDLLMGIHIDFHRPIPRSVVFFLVSVYVKGLLSTT